MMRHFILVLILSHFISGDFAWAGNAFNRSHNEGISRQITGLNIQVGNNRNEIRELNRRISERNRKITSLIRQKQSIYSVKSPAVREKIKAANKAIEGDIEYNRLLNNQDKNNINSLRDANINIGTQISRLKASRR